MTNTESKTLVKVPDEIMKIPASQKWATEVTSFLNSCRIKFGKPVFFIIGEYKNGKFIPFDDTGCSQAELLEAYHKLLNIGKLGNMGLYVADNVDLDNIYLN